MRRRTIVAITASCLAGVTGYALGYANPAAQHDAHARPTSALTATAPAPPGSYTYPSTVISVHDGDTATVNMVLEDRINGFGLHVLVDQPRSLRFLDINAPELNTQAGKDALTYLLTLVHVGDRITVLTERDHDEKYGRTLATLCLPGDAVSINQHMLDTAHAVTYLATIPLPTCPVVAP